MEGLIFRIKLGGSFKDRWVLNKKLSIWQLTYETLQYFLCFSYIYFSFDYYHSKGVDDQSHTILNWQVIVN